MNEQTPAQPAPTYERTHGRKYDRIVKVESPGWKYVEAFQERETGTWYGPDGWKRPNLRHRLAPDAIARLQQLLGETP